MRAVVHKDAKVFQVENIPDVVSKDGRIVIEVKKEGICGSDIHVWEMGEYIDFVPGHEFCGVVLDPGESEFKEGDRVVALSITPCGKCEACLSGKPQCCPETWAHSPGSSVELSGGYAEKSTVRKDLARKLPDNVSYEEGAMVEPLSVSLHGARLAEIKKGDKVLVIGGGIIGLGCAMFAKMEGADFVAVSETNPNRAKKAISLGVADKIYDAKAEDYMQNAFADAPGGFDCVIDCVGLAATINAGLVLVKGGHRLVLVGIAMVPQGVQTMLATLREVSMVGSSGYNFEEFEEVIQMCADKSIDATKFIDEIIGLDGAQEAMFRLTGGDSDVVKIVIDPTK